MRYLIITSLLLAASAGAEPKRPTNIEEVEALRLAVNNAEMTKEIIIRDAAIQRLQALEREREAIFSALRKKYGIDPERDGIEARPPYAIRWAAPDPKAPPPPPKK